jgi:hypothetical protein
MTKDEALKLALEALEYEAQRENDNAYLHERKTLRQAIEQAEKQEPVALEWDEVYDAAASAYCRSEASRKALRLCFQSREQPTQISIGWTANELMTFAKTIAYVCTTPQPQQAEKQEPVAKDWEGAEYWMPLAWELCADECGEDACNDLIWEGGPIPEPWGDRWLKYEDEAKRLIALVQKHTTPLAAQRQWVGLTDEEVKKAPHHVVDGAYHYSFKQGAQWADAKLKEKNT